MPRETVHNPAELSFVCDPGAIKIEALAEGEAASKPVPMACHGCRGSRCSLIPVGRCESAAGAGR